MILTEPVFYTEATNASIGPMAVAQTVVITPEAGLGLVVGVSTSRLVGKNVSANLELFHHSIA